MKNVNKYYKPSELANLLNLSTSSIRRYTLTLEKSGYPLIDRDDNGHRLYTIEDIRVLQYFHRLISERKISQDEAIKKTLKDVDMIMNQSDDLNTALTETDKIDKLIELITLQTEQIEELKRMNIELMNVINKSIAVNSDENKALIDDKNTAVTSDDSKAITSDNSTDDINAIDDDNNANNEPMSAPVSDDIANNMNAFKPQQMDEVKTKVNEVESQHKETNIGRMVRENEEATNKKSIWTKLFGRRR